LAQATMAAVHDALSQSAVIPSGVIRERRRSRARLASRLRIQLFEMNRRKENGSFALAEPQVDRLAADPDLRTGKVVEIARSTEPPLARGPGTMHRVPDVGLDRGQKIFEKRFQSVVGLVCSAPR